MKFTTNTFSGDCVNSFIQQAVGGERVVEFVVGESFLAAEARQLFA